MVKAAALNLMNALEGQKVPASAVMAFDAGGNESWTVEINPAFVLTGAQLAQLAQYCAGQGLVMTAAFSELGIA